MAIICLAGQLYFAVLIARMLFSWFPPSQDRDSPVEKARELSYNLTEPVLAPVRRVVPPMGMFDLSFLVVIIGYRIVLGALGCGLFI